MSGFISDSPLARGLIRIGDEAIARADDAKLRGYFAEDYVFHGPGGDLCFERAPRVLRLVAWRVQRPAARP
jgi:hypothetical protein